MEVQGPELAKDKAEQMKGHGPKDFYARLRLPASGGLRRSTWSEIVT